MISDKILEGIAYNGNATTDDTKDMARELLDLRASHRNLAEMVLDQYSPCKTEQRGSRTWCMTHNAKNCEWEELAETAKAALAEARKVQP